MSDVERNVVSFDNSREVSTSLDSFAFAASCVACVMPLAGSAIAQSLIAGTFAALVLCSLQSQIPYVLVPAPRGDASNRKPMMRFLSFAARMLPLLALPAALNAQFMTELAPQTNQAFEQYEKAAEARMDWQAHLSPAPGEVKIAASEANSLIEVTGGLIHDWRAATYAQGATVEQVLAVLEDYANYKTIYAPEVTDSRVLSHDGNRWRLYLRLVKKKVLTVTLDTEYEADYKSLGNGRWAKLSHSVKLTEVSGGKQLPAGTGHGFLWRLDSYWLVEPRPDGVYMECRSISLSRNIPAVLDWIVRPMVTSVPRESLRGTLEATVRALGKQHPAISLHESAEGN